MQALPNEVWIECFKYLDALNIFYSFDRLNSRFSTLIRNIPLSVDFCHISTSKYYDICTRFFSDPKIKRQIYSLKITNQNKIAKEIIRSTFPYDEFVNLRSWSWINIQDCYEPIWPTEFSNLPQLYCFHLINCRCLMANVVSNLQMSRLRILTIPVLSSSVDFSHNFKSITTLTVANCGIAEVHNLLTWAKSLQCLHVTYVRKLNTSEEWQEKQRVKDLVKNHPSVSVRELTLNYFADDVCFLEGILKRTPDLIILTLLHYGREQLYYFLKWQHCIYSLLVKLKQFNFTFEYVQNGESIQDQLTQQRIQMIMWHYSTLQQQNRQECILTEKYSKMYTLPYPLDTYILPSLSQVHFNHTVDHTNQFNKVKCLKLDVDIIANECPLYFPYITSIYIGNCCLNEKYINALTSIANLANLNELFLADNCKLEKSFVLLEIFKQSLNLSLLSISVNVLLTLLDNDQLREYLSKNIKRLILSQCDDQNLICKYQSKIKLDHIEDSVNDLYRMTKLWKIFENIEELHCIINQQQSIQFLLETLSKLSYVEIRSKTVIITPELVRFVEQEIGPNLGIKIVGEISRVCDYGQCLSLWIVRTNI